MIPRSRMKIDLVGQAILLIGLILNLAVITNFQWAKYLLIFLVLWQISSAVHLYLVYRYTAKLGYLMISSVTILSLFIWIQIIGIWAYLPVLGIALWYFLQTLNDTLVVISRPRYFWDLF